MFFFFFFNDTATTEIYTLSLHDVFRSHANADPVSEEEIENGLIPEIIEILEKKSSYQPWTGKKRADEEAEYRPWLGKRSNGSDKDSKEAYMWSRLKKAAKQYQWNRMRRNQYQWSRL